MTSFSNAIILQRLVDDIKIIFFKICNEIIIAFSDTDFCPFSSIVHLFVFSQTLNPKKHKINVKINIFKIDVDC